MLEYLLYFYFFRSNRRYGKYFAWIGIFCLIFWNHFLVFNSTIVAKIFLSHGAIVDVGDNENHTPLLNACANGNAHNKWIEFLLAIQVQHPLWINIWFIFVGRFEMAKLLLEYGANVNFKNNNKEVPLHLAARNGNFQTNLKIKYF